MGRNEESVEGLLASPAGLVELAAGSETDSPQASSTADAPIPGGKVCIVGFGGKGPDGERGFEFVAALNDPIEAESEMEIDRVWSMVRVVGLLGVTAVAVGHWALSTDAPLALRGVTVILVATIVSLVPPSIEEIAGAARSARVSLRKAKESLRYRRLLLVR